MIKKEECSVCYRNTKYKTLCGHIVCSLCYLHIKKLSCHCPYINSLFIHKTKKIKKCRVCKKKTLYTDIGNDGLCCSCFLWLKNICYDSKCPICRDTKNFYLFSDTYIT